MRTPMKDQVYEEMRIAVADGLDRPYIPLDLIQLGALVQIMFEEVHDLRKRVDDLERQKPINSEVDRVVAATEEDRERYRL